MELSPNAYSPTRRSAYGYSGSYTAGASIQNRRNDNVFSVPEDYLESITTTLDLQKDILLHSIHKSMSNQYMSVLIIRLEKKSLQQQYNNNIALLRCYNDQKKFFEMPLPYIPQFIDIYDSIVAWTVGGNDDLKQIFYAIDVGRKYNKGRNTDEQEGEPEPREFEHEFEPEDDGELMGFKLGHFANPDEGNVKAVFWSKKKMYRFPFNTKQEKMDEDEKFFTKNQGFIEFDEIEEDQIEQIFDFGVREGHTNEYDDDIPEVVLLLDTDQNIHVLKGTRYGKIFTKHISYPFDIEDDSKNNVPIKQVYDLALISTFKIVGVIEKVSKGKGQVMPYIQVFEFDYTEAESVPYMTREYEIVQDKLDLAINGFRNNFVVDNLNQKCYIKDFSGKNEQIQLIDLNNAITNVAVTIYIDIQVVMNIVANNIRAADKKEPIGLIYTDYLCADNLLILNHGKVITCFDLMDKSQSFTHTRLYPSETIKNKKDYYNMDDEALYVWLMDKNVKKTSERWKIIVAFTSGDVKELSLQYNREQSVLSLKNYLQDKDRAPVKLPGRIVRIIRNRNEANIPIYFITEDEQKRQKLSTIEFWSKTFRTFDMPGVGEDNQGNVTYVMLGLNDSQKVWQELICIVTRSDVQNDYLEQKLFHIKIRVGQYETERSKEVIVLNKEDLPGQMNNVLQARDIFVNGQMVYFVYADHVELYNIAENSVLLEYTRASVLRMLSFGNRYFYWRQTLGGISENRYLNKIYFDGFELFSQFGTQSDNEDVMLFEGIFPHLNKLQYDSMSESVACFTSFYEIKVFPMLHLPRIKVKVEGNKEDDFHIIATKLIAPHAFCILQNNNRISAWNVKTGKYMLLNRYLSEEEGDLSSFIFHQRITDTLTLLKSKEPIYKDEEEAMGSFHPLYDMTDMSDENKKIQMYKYKVIEIVSEQIVGENVVIQPTSIKVVTHKKFIGPHYQDSIRVNFGLYASDDLDLYAFMYKNSQEKMQLKYCRIIDEEFKIDGDPEVYNYLQKQWKAETEHARLSIHSPNFKNIVVNSGIRDYEVLDTSEMMSTIAKLPRNLNYHTVDTPNFITNTNILFLSEDKIVKCYNFQDKKEEFIVSHCHFPGATENINLASILKVGKHIIGENCLTYEQEQNEEGQKIDEFIAPNNFNYFFLDAVKQYENSEDFNEIKIVQCHYKNKIELIKRSIFGYFFTQKEYESGKISTQIYVISTYSFYQWRLLKLLKDQKVSASVLGVQTLENLAYVQTPNGETLLHCLYKNKTALEYVMKELQVEDEYGCQFYVPLFRDRRNYTALDYALNYKQPEKPEDESNLKAVATVEDDYDPDAVNVANRKTAGIILKHVGTYPYDLFKVHMKELIAPILELGLIEFSEFITNCCKTPSFLRGYDRAQVDVVEECGAQVFTYNEVWASDELDFQSQFESKNAEEKLISIKILDIAFIHHYTNSENNLIYQQLSNTEDRSIFQNVAIKSMIEQKWSLVKQKVALFLLLPYLLFLTIFTYFTVNEYYSDKVVGALREDNPSIIVLTAFLRVCIVVFAFYFFGVEIIQAYREGYKEHLSDFWNYLDVIPPVVILTCEIINFSDDGTSQKYGDLVDQRDELMRKLYSITALAMWLRFLYFFRIFRSTGYYISMIVEVINDMGQFFFIFLITIISFAHTFFIYFGGYEITAMEDDGKQGQIDPVTGEFSKERYMANFFGAVTYSYRIALGDFDTDNLYAPMAWFFFIIATLFVQIVFLNLLISIVGETFGRVQEDKANMMYQDMVDLIVENQFLITEAQQAQTNTGKYILITVPDDQDVVQEEVIQKNFDELKSEVRIMQDTVSKKMQQTDYFLDRLLKSVKKLQDNQTEHYQEWKSTQGSALQ